MDCNFSKIYKMTDHIFIGFNGLQSDAQSFSQQLKYEVNSYKLRENREISPEAFASLVRTKQYQHRFGPFFVEPVIAGLNKVALPSFLSRLEWRALRRCHGHDRCWHLRAQIRCGGHVRRESARYLRGLVILGYDADP